MYIPTISNMTSSGGNKIANQFLIEWFDKEGIKHIAFQSYQSIIADKSQGKISLDLNKWDYSKTTGKYRNIFLGENKKETQTKIDSGIYVLEDLNTAF